ncbi:dihydroxyacetone kinase subunit DhaL [Tengunoibacter tsumagoiensis]|uniref:DhaL domain-containing protein n=1 Tax=Tengunoibacter tsumagoiensis TaxID=2014871 RepID=A0A401ZXR0_9CHLR|nr:dihydroxyacetone kinase subunit DhaL [Tengunoibacter tsumagoiensis]GCE11622.1 hypothetical protein KTT_14810 [Tengunoibacter tsumagoiensis]
MAGSSLETVRFVVKTIAETAIEKEKEFNELDSAAGDGDFGTTLARGFRSLLAEWKRLEKDTRTGEFLKDVTLILIRYMGGTSGPIWGTAFLRAGTAAGDKQELHRADVSEMFQAAVQGIEERGRAKLGDKTLLDALIPAVESLTKGLSSSKTDKEVLAEAARVARASAEATRDLVAKRGRASYTGEESQHAPDAGAMAVAILFEKISDSWM